MQNRFKIAETATFKKNLEQREYKAVYKKIVTYGYPQLTNNPFFGPNIKKLKGELSGIYRYRIADYRLFYTIVEEKVMVFIIDIKKQKNSY